MTSSPAPSRKPIRLPDAAYAVPGSAWLITIGTAGRIPAFTDPALADAVTSLIETRCTVMGSSLEAYCLMPDHLHLLLHVTEGNLTDIVRDIKSRTTRLWWQHGGTGTLWQRSFHDRGLRTANAYDDTLTYLLNNPVRAGLVTDWTDYPFLGGIAVRPSPPTPPEDAVTPGSTPMQTPSPTVGENPSRVVP